MKRCIFTNWQRACTLARIEAGRGTTSGKREAWEAEPTAQDAPRRGHRGGRAMGERAQRQQSARLRIKTSGQPGQQPTSWTFHHPGTTRVRCMTASRVNAPPHRHMLNGGGQGGPTTTAARWPSPSQQQRACTLARIEKWKTGIRAYGTGRPAAGSTGHGRARTTATVRAAAIKTSGQPGQQPTSWNPPPRGYP